MLSQLFSDIIVSGLVMMYWCQNYVWSQSHYLVKNWPHSCCFFFCSSICMRYIHWVANSSVKDVNYLTAYTSDLSIEVETCAKPATLFEWADKEWYINVLQILLNNTLPNSVFPSHRPIALARLKSLVSHIMYFYNGEEEERVSCLSQ